MSSSKSYTQFSQSSSVPFISNLSEYIYPATQTQLTETVFQESHQKMANKGSVRKENHSKNQHSSSQDNCMKEEYSRILESSGSQQQITVQLLNNTRNQDEWIKRQNRTTYLGVVYRIVLTHYASMKKEVLFVPFVRGNKKDYLLGNLQQFLDFDVAQLIKRRNQQQPFKQGQILAIKPSGKLNYQAIYFCMIPHEVTSFREWQRVANNIIKNILVAMYEYDHRKIVFPHFRINGLPEVCQIIGFLIGFMNASKKMHIAKIEHQMTEFMLTTSNKIHYEIWKDMLKISVQRATSSKLHMNQAMEFDDTP